MIRQSFAWWSFAMDPATDPRALLAGAAGAGAKGVEMLPDDLWPVAQDLGLTVVTLSGHALETGFNDPSRHAALRDEVRRRIDDAAAGGCEAVIVFSGSRIGDGADAPAIAACVEGLGPVVEHAKGAGVRLLLELLNSKVDHPGQQCDRTAFGAAVVRQLDDPGLRVSARNAIAGVALRCETSPLSAEVIIDIGDGKTLAAHITAHSAQALKIEPGVRLRALFDSAHVILAID